MIGPESPVDYDTHRSLLSESRFPCRTNISHILQFLRATKSTGRLIIKISQGGVNTITFEELHPVDGSLAIEIR